MATLTPEATSVALSTERILSEPELECWFLQNLEQIQKSSHLLSQMRAIQDLAHVFFDSVGGPTREELRKDCQARADYVRKSIPIAPDAHLRLRVVAKVILSDPTRFDMKAWHCGTSHCIAGWAEELAGGPAHAMWETYRLSHEALGAILLGPDAMTHFYDTNEEALEYLRDLED